MIGRRNLTHGRAADRDSELEVASGTGSYEWRPAEDRLDWSIGLLHIYGVGEAPTAEEGFSRLLHPEDRMRVEAETTGFLSSKSTRYSHCFRIVRPDGTVRTILDRGVIERDAKGCAVAIKGTNVDLTDFAGGKTGPVDVSGQDIEVQLLRRNRQLDLLGRASRRLLADDGADREVLEETCTDVARMLGFDGYFHFRAFSPGWLGLEVAGGLTPDEREAVEVIRLGELLCGRVAQTRTPLLIEDLQSCTEDGADMLKAWGGTLYVGLPIVARDTLLGTLAFVARQRSHLHDGEAQTLNSLCDQIAVSLQRRRLQRELQESERRFKLALGGSPITVFEHDAALRYQWLFNSKLGYSDTFAIGKTDDEIMEPTAAQVLTAFKRRVLLSGRSAREEVIAAAPGRPIEHFDLHIHPRRDEQGRIDGLTCVSTDITEQRNSKERLRQSEERFRGIFENAAIGIAITALDGAILSCNPAFEAMTGRTEADLCGADLCALAHEEDRPDTTMHLRRLAAGRTSSFEALTRLEREGGAFPWVQMHASLLRDAQGRPDQVVALFSDRTEVHLAADRQKMLIRELEHRAKNLLAILQSVVNRTLSGDVSLEHARSTLNGRLRALAHTYTTLTDARLDGAALHDIVAEEVRPFERRVVISGPGVALLPHTAQAFTLVVHELATNAAKHGALSVPSGKLHVSWQILDTGADERFAFEWKEVEGPSIHPPRRTGFGTTIITRVAGDTFGCHPELVYAPQGFQYRLEASLKDIGTPVDPR